METQSWSDVTGESGERSRERIYVIIGESGERSREQVYVITERVVASS